MLYSFENRTPEPIPDVIRLSNGDTRTDKSQFTDEEIADAGYVAVEDPPEYDALKQRVVWNSSTTPGTWEVQDIPVEELWQNPRELRTKLMDQFEWRISRHRREVDLGMETTEELTPLLQYMQALADITKQPDPTNLDWPIPPGYTDSVPYSTTSGSNL